MNLTNLLQFSSKKTRYDGNAGFVQSPYRIKFITLIDSVLRKTTLKIRSSDHMR